MPIIEHFQSFTKDTSFQISFLLVLLLTYILILLFSENCKLLLLLFGLAIYYFKIIML